MLKRFRSPTTVFLNLTDACNLRCVYCSADAGSRSKDELSGGELLEVARELISANVCDVILTGGEPFLRPELWDLIRLFTEAGIGITILTNGTLISDEVAAHLSSPCIRKVGVSLDAADPETNALSRGAGSFATAYNGILALLRHDIAPSIIATVTALNFRGVRRLVDEMARLKVKRVGLNMVAPCGRAAKGYGGLALDSVQVREFVELVRGAIRDYGDFVGTNGLRWVQIEESYDAAHEHPNGGPTLLPCSAGTTACAITAAGWVTPCNHFESYRFGSVREQTLEAIWKCDKILEFRKLRDLRTADAPGCAQCCYNRTCNGGCRAQAYGAFGDLRAPDPGCAVLPASGIHAYMNDPATRAAHFDE